MEGGVPRTKLWGQGVPKFEFERSTAFPDADNSRNLHRPEVV